MNELVMPDVDRERTLVYTTKRGEPADHIAFLDLMNRAERVVASDLSSGQKRASLEDLFCQADSVLERFVDARNPEGISRSRRPAGWLEPTMRSILASRRGAATEALRLGRMALEFAERVEDPELISIALSNQAEYASAVGDVELAADYAERAIQQNGGQNTGVLITAAKALFKAGRKDLADAALKQAGRFLADHPQSVVRAHGEFEGELVDMIELESARVILEHASSTARRAEQEGL